MMNASNDVSDAAQFLFSTDEMNKFPSNDNVIQPSENVFLEDLERRELESLDSNQLHQQMHQDLLHDPRITNTNNLNNQYEKIESLYLYPHISSTCNSSSNFLPSHPTGDLESQRVLLNSNELVYQNLSLMQPKQNELAQRVSNSVQLNEPMYPNNSNSQEPAPVKTSIPSISNNKRSVLLTRLDESHSTSIEPERSPSIYNKRSVVPSFPMTFQTLDIHDPLVLVPLSMLQIDRSKAGTSQQTISSPQSQSDLPSEIENHRIQSQDKHPLISKEQKSGSFSTQLCHKNTSTARKLVHQYLIRRRNIENNQKRRNKNVSKTVLIDVEELSSSIEKVKENIKIYETDQNDSSLCKVCGEEATKYIHYGGRSCASCRAFFRRSVESIAKSQGYRYFCNCVENCWNKEQPICDVNKLTRNNCKYCRYEKCMNMAGMKKQWVISAHIPKVKETQTKEI